MNFIVGLTAIVIMLFLLYKIADYIKEKWMT